MAKRSTGNTGKPAKAAAAAHNPQQKGRQQGHNTGKEAWKSNLEHVDNQPGTGQVGQHPREGEPFGSTPGEVRGHPGGKHGQAQGGKRGTAKSRNAKPKRGGKQAAGQ
jgi:hypothetical protein